MSEETTKYKGVKIIIGAVYGGWQYKFDLYGKHYFGSAMHKFSASDDAKLKIDALKRERKVQAVQP